MQKKIIALAVAGLVSGAAFAQSNVTIYGIMDMGYQYSWDSLNAGSKNQSAIKSGGQDGSRVGFKGTEDLGNGLRANFDFTAGFNADTGASYGGRLMSEGAWVGLSGARWGEVRAGHFGTFLDDNTGIDVTGRVGISSTGAVNQYQGKYNNFAAWYSPIWSGFQVKAGFATNDTGNAGPTNDVEATRGDGLDGQNFTNNRIYTASATYANGGLKLGAVYEHNKFQKVSYTGVNPGSFDAGNKWQLGAAYDFKVVAVSLLGGRINYAQNNDGVSGSGSSAVSVNGEVRDYRNQWALGLAVPLGAKDKITLGYGQAKINYNVAGFRNDKEKGWGVGYFHNLSKRTNLYALYGNFNGDDRNTLAGTDFNPRATIGADGQYQQAFNVGIRHLF